MRLLHTMLRVGDLQRSIEFYTNVLGMKLLRTSENTEYKYSLAFVGYGEESDEAVIELTYNWDGDDALPSDSRHFGHLAYRTDDIYALCQKLMDAGVTINRPPRDGHMAFVRSPDLVSVELLQDGHLPPQEPWFPAHPLVW